jgi:hypothetical protein
MIQYFFKSTVQLSTTTIGAELFTSAGVLMRKRAPSGATA